MPHVKNTVMNNVNRPGQGQNKNNRLSGTEHEAIYSQNQAGNAAAGQPEQQAGQYTQNILATSQDAQQETGQ